MQQYLATKNEDMGKCTQQYTNLLNDPSGSAFTNAVLEPIYNKLSEKFCSPYSTVNYATQLLDVPNNVYSITETIATMQQNIHIYGLLTIAIASLLFLFIFKRKLCVAK